MAVDGGGQGCDAVTWALVGNSRVTALGNRSATSGRVCPIVWKLQPWDKFAVV